MPLSVLVIGEPLAPMSGVELVTAPDRAAALELLGRGQIDAVIARYRMKGESGLEVLRDCMRARPDARRLLLADYADLPEIVGARARGLITRVVPLLATPDKLERALREALTAQDELSTSRSAVHGPAWEEIEALVRFSAARLAQVRGAIVRPLAPDPHALQLQFVLRGQKRIEALRADLVRHWLLPLKARGAKVDRGSRKHPVIKRLGGLTAQAELWVHDAPVERLSAWLALLPWSSEPRITAVVGLCSERYQPEQWALLADAHRQAIEELSEFALPDPSGSDRDRRFGLAVPEYDWIVTSTYVGLDRRQTPTSFLNRFVFFGRRRHVPTRLARVSDSFIDRPGRRIWRWLALYLAFATIDTVLTYVCVRAGLVREENPLLRPLVLHHTVAYLLLKNALAVLAFLLISRFQLFRLGTLFLGAAVLAWVALDVYWAALLWKLFFTG